ncbi:MAG: hypothetical protein K5892_02685 [Acholeplasmatales bacterium]|nr:hypothetical protein [Acholeplasmatales bacterium]
MDNKSFEKFFIALEIISLIIDGFISSFVLVYVLLNDISGKFLVSSLFMCLATIVIMIYSLLEFKLNRKYFIISISFFTVAIILNMFLPFRDAFQIVLLSILLIFVLLFSIFCDDYKLSMIFIICALVAAFTFSFYSLIDASTNNLNNVNLLFLSDFAMNSSIFSPTMITVVYFIVYFNRNNYL